jgi:hypothetical protein
MVGEGVEFGHAMSPAAPSRQQPLKVDALCGLAAALAHDGGQRAAGSCNVEALSFLEKIEKLSKRDFVAPIGGQHGRNVTSVKPSLERRLTYSEKPRRCRRPDSGAERAFDEFARLD